MNVLVTGASGHVNALHRGRNAALTYEVMFRVIGKAPLLTRERVVSAVGNYSYFDCSKARKELGYAPKELAQTLPSTIEWLLKRFK